MTLTGNKMCFFDDRMFMTCLSITTWYNSKGERDEEICMWKFFCYKLNVHVTWEAKAISGHVMTLLLFLPQNVTGWMGTDTKIVLSFSFLFFLSINVKDESVKVESRKERDHQEWVEMVRSKVPFSIILSISGSTIKYIMVV